VGFYCFPPPPLLTFVPKGFCLLFATVTILYACT
jgi:hypothetical protein